MPIVAETTLVGADNWTAARHGPRPTPGGVWTFRAFWYAALAMPLLFGGPITRAAAGCALFFGILADRQGATRHVFRLVGLAAGIWWAPALGVPFGQWLAPRLGAPLLVGQILGVTLAGLAAVFAAGLVGRSLSKLLWRRAALRGADHVFGSLLGSGEGVLLVATVCWALATFAEPLGQLHDRLEASGRTAQNPLLSKLVALRAAIDSDPAGQLLTSVNPLPAIPAVKTAQEMAAVAADGEAFAAALRDPKVRAFSRLPVVRKHLDALENDAALSRALRDRDIGTIVQSDAVRDLLNDRELYETLLAHWDELSSALAGLNVADLKRRAGSGGFQAQLNAARQTAQRLEHQMRSAP